MKWPSKTAFQGRGVRIATASILAAATLYITFVTHVEPSERGIARNWVTGELRLLEPGWHISSPWTWVAIVDVRPMRVSVQSAGRGFSAKLVQFDVTGWREFVQTEGWRYYWWANRLSFNYGHHEEHRGMKDILRGYAYGHHDYPFIKILEEYRKEARPDSIAQKAKLSGLFHNCFFAYAIHHARASPRDYFYCDRVPCPTVLPAHPAVPAYAKRIRSDHAENGAA